MINQPPRSQKNIFYARIASDDYCCLYGYLRLCLARGQDAASMAEYTGVHINTVRYHLRRMKDEKIKCQKRGINCLIPDILEIEKKGP